MTPDERAARADQIAADLLNHLLTHAEHPHTLGELRDALGLEPGDIAQAALTLLRSGQIKWDYQGRTVRRANPLDRDCA